MTRAVRVALTRAHGGNDELAARLREEGFEPVECPLIRIEAIDGPPIDTGSYDWLLLTSRTAVDLVIPRLVGDLPPIAVIGPGTATALRERGITPALVASESTQEGLARQLPKPAGRVLFAAAEGARTLLVDELQADFVPLYRAVEETPAAFPDCDLVVLASASAARAFAALERDLPCISIGPVTTANARGLLLDVRAEAESPDPDALVRAVKLAASSIASSRS